MTLGEARLGQEEADLPVGVGEERDHRLAGGDQLARLEEGLLDEAARRRLERAPVEGGSSPAPAPPAARRRSARRRSISSGRAGQLGDLELALGRVDAGLRGVAPALGLVDRRLGDDLPLAEHELARVVVARRLSVGLAPAASCACEHGDLLGTLAGAEIGELRLGLGEPRLGAGDRLLLVGVVEAEEERALGDRRCRPSTGRSTMRPARSGET